MQFNDEDRGRYLTVSKTTTEMGRGSLRDLTTYVRGERAVHCEGSGYRIVTNEGKHVQLAGAHRVLTECLWSDAQFRSAAASRSKKRKRSSSSSGAVLEFDDGRAYFGPTAGLARGKDVHEQVAHFVMWEASRFRSTYPCVDPMTKAVLLHLASLKFTGVHAEYIVYDKSLLAGTAVDLICLDSLGNMVFVELKTGYRDVFTKPSGKFLRKPFAHVEDTPLNRARTQLLYAIALYATNHQLTPHGRVVHVDGVHDVVSFDMGPLRPTPTACNALLGLLRTRLRRVTRKKKEKASAQRKGARRR